MTDSTTNHRRTIGICRIAVVTLAVIALVLLVVVIILADKLRGQSANTMEPCPDSASSINIDPPSVLPPFHDLTKDEIMAVKQYLYGQDDLKLMRPGKQRTNSSFIFTMDLNIPNKKDVLDYLDKGTAQPERQAKVMIMRGDIDEAQVEEYVVGPLPNPTYKKDLVTRPFQFRPLSLPENDASFKMLYDKVHETVGNILKERYGASVKDCGNRCLGFLLANPVSSGSSGDTRSRKMWYWLTHDIEFHSIQNLDFSVLMDLTSKNPDEYKIEKVAYANEVFDSLEEMKTAYEQGSLPKTKVEFPKTDREMFSTLNRRGKTFPEKPLSPPEEYEPNGRRYSINGRHIKYMGWDFDVRMSVVSGPQVFDIRYNGRRIVYELSLQEIGALYSAHNPAHRFSNFADSVFLIGSRARGLVPGVDCPRHATFLSTTLSLERSEEAVTYPAATCVFEHNTAMPLRRHHAFEYFEKQFFEGMADTVLVVRSLHTVVNYDYIFDFVFHQNGAVEVKAVSNGYILASFRRPAEDVYGLHLNDHLVGNIHHHVFHFKVDMDINGRENRFQVLEVTPTKIDNSKWSQTQNGSHFQTKLLKREIQREKEAAIKYNFDKPKYLTFYNKDNKSPQGVPRAYRLFVKGMSKQMLPENFGAEPSFSWARYQVAVTRQKDTEKRSSSVYAIWDAANPVVNFQSFIDDNEVITDKDQVAWVTMGIHHIPHMEDLPVTPTVGLSLEFFLLPYNYFDEDPAMGSSDAIRIEPNDMAHAQNGVRIERYGKDATPSCRPRKPSFLGQSYDEMMLGNPGLMFDKTRQ